MKRNRHHKVKKETAETSTSLNKGKQEQDLAYYIHDRVELMRQVFSVLKYKDLKMMAPECVRHISVDDLQELCMEELLGISSKRLCAIMDGADPPSDTESSSASPEHMETISLDSISSDEEILSQSSSKKKKRKHRSKSKKSPAKESSQDNRASRAGLTVLELLELQARARAIRAQLQKEQKEKQPSESVVDCSRHSSDNEVLIKEEAREVVEISSDEDEKPKLEQLEITPAPETAKPSESELKETVKSPVKSNEPQTVTKHVNDLVITVPQAKTARKIKLNRNKVTVSVTNKPNVDNASNTDKNVAVAEKTIEIESKKGKDKNKKKKKDKKKKEKDGSDHDEITLQLSDTEKMDLLEDLGNKNYEVVSTNSSEDSESSSESDDDSETINIDHNTSQKEKTKRNSKTAEIIVNSTAEPNIKSTIVIPTHTDPVLTSESASAPSNYKESTEKITEAVITEATNIENNTNNVHIEKPTEIVEEVTDKNQNIEPVTISNDGSDSNVDKITTQPESVKDCNGSNDIEQCKTTEVINTESHSDKAIETTSIEDIPVVNNKEDSSERKSSEKDIAIESNNSQSAKTIDTDETTTKLVEPQITNENKNLSEGEVTDRESSEVETIELQPEVVCISDDEGGKKKKKKDKKKKVKKAKKSKKLDFRSGEDQNFYRDSNVKEHTVAVNEEENEKKHDKNIEVLPEIDIRVAKDKDDSDKNDLIEDKDIASSDKTNTSNLIIINDDEVLELSDDSSCYEVEGTMLSKEPTTEEIEALSAKIDEIDRQEVVTDEQIQEHERIETEKELENISWKDRYLDSRKVKQVLSTSNILNALRKKNKQLKKKLEESRKEVEVKVDIQEPIQPPSIVPEGSIEQYNTLEGSSKYVDSVEEPHDELNGVTREMKKDAKQLLKMYKKLLKYNDMNKQKPKDPNKKKKKKKKVEKKIVLSCKIK